MADRVQLRHSRCGSGVDALFKRHEPDSPPFELLPELLEMLEGPGDPVDPRDDDRIDLARPDHPKEYSEPRTVLVRRRAAGVREDCEKSGALSERPFGPDRTRDGRLLRVKRIGLTHRLVDHGRPDVPHRANAFHHVLL